GHRLGEFSPRSFRPCIRHAARRRAVAFGLRGLRRGALGCGHRAAVRRRSGALALTARMRLRELLVTGADGYIGGSVCAELLAAHPEVTLHCWMRAADPQEFERKRAKLAAELPAAAGLHFHYGDLRADEPFNGVPLDGIDAIVHTAAVIRFNVESD